MRKFNSIESFTHLIQKIKGAAAFDGYSVESIAPIPYKGTLKLHGTNASVIIRGNGEIVACSRSEELLSASQSHFGFYVFVHHEVDKEVWYSIANTIRQANKLDDDSNIVVYGEWVGKGIQKGVALSELPKHLVIFHAAEEEGDILEHSFVLSNANKIYHIEQVPSYSISIDLQNLEFVSSELNRITKLVEDECPWAKTMFGVSGIGEGVVWYPKDDVSATSRWFKTKGDKHAVRQSPTKNVAPIDWERVNTIKEIVSIILTEARMLQMISDHNIALDMKQTGPFLKAVSADCLKEEFELIRSNNLEWKEVAKVIQANARDWFKDYVTRSIMESN